MDTAGPQHQQPTSPAWTRLAFLLGVALLIVHLAAAWRSCGVPDSWRDVYFATRIVQGQEYPLAGPPIYGIFQLGPWWYYLLAIPIALGGKAVGAALATQLLAFLKYPLAFRVGQRLRDARLGFFLVAALALSGWSFVPMMFPTHTAVVEAAVFALALVVMRGREHFDLRAALAYGLASAVCVHAHPTTLPYLIAGGLVLIHAQRGRGIAGVALAVAIVMASLAPSWFAGAAERSAQLGSIQGYAQHGWQGIPPSRVLRLAGGFIGGGVDYGYRYMTRWRASAADLAVVLHALVLLAALVGYVRAALARRSLPLRVAPALLGLIALDLAFLVALRAETPIWMASSALPLFALLYATGWDELANAGPRTAAALAGVVLAGALLALTPASFFVRRLESVRVPSTANPLMDVAAFPSSGSTEVEISRISVRELEALAPGYCDGADLHGELAAAFERALAQPVALACGDDRGLRYAGTDRAALHEVGLTRTVWTRLGLAPERYVDDLGVSRQLRPIAPADGLSPVRLTSRDIHRDYGLGSAQTIALDVVLAPGEVLAVGNHAAPYAPLTIRRVGAAGGGDWPALFEHSGYRYYRGSGSPTALTLSLEVDPANLDVFVLTPPGGAPARRN